MIARAQPLYPARLRSPAPTWSRTGGKADATYAACKGANDLSDDFMPNLAAKQQTRRAAMRSHRIRTGSQMPSSATILSIVVAGRTL